MIPDARILIATDTVGDADLLTQMLGEEHANVAVSLDPKNSFSDFSEFKPHVILVAFSALAKAEQYYLDLFRDGTSVHELPHRALVLCDKTNVNQAYELCREGHFDDYILFWPLSFDTRRLLMAVNRALRDLEKQAGTPAMLKMAAQARRIAELEAVLSQNMARGAEHTATACKTLQGAGVEIGAVIDEFSNRLLANGIDDAVEVRDVSRFQNEVERFKAEGIRRHAHAAEEAVAPLNQWIIELNEEVAPHLEAVRSLQEFAEIVRPTILIVDDDAFQCKVLAQVLGAKPYDLVFAASGPKALSALQKRLPDLILMDVDMPEMNGVQVTRRLKSTEQLASIPVIMITGKSRKDVVIDSLRAGATDFVVKPFDKEILLSKIAKLLQGAVVPS